MQENTSLLNNQGNTNLFFHPWLFDHFQAKNVSIGLFHPHGSIHATTNTPYLNTLLQLEQNYHAPQHYSPNNSHIFIDRNNFGYAVAVCLDQHRLGPRARIELLIYSPNDMFDLLKPINDKIDSKTLRTDELINELSSISQFNFVKDFFNNMGSNIVQTPEFNFGAHASKGLFMFDYTGNSYVYNKLMHVDLQINESEFPFINEIKEKIPDTIKDLISFEFGLQIINYKL